MKPDWTPLTSELVIWRREGMSLPVWWRDDDAVADTPELERLSRLATDIGLPVHLAVIPKDAQPSLTRALAGQSSLVPVVHGWSHTNHAPEGAKKAEFGHPRSDARRELSLAVTRLKDQFGAAALPLFVPPWNRIEPGLLPALADAGYSGLSTYGPRDAVLATPGVVQINTHIDPVFWRGERGLVPPDELIAQLVATLRDRRAGRTDAGEPLGLLTHHLVHTADVWDFCGDVLRVLLDGGAVPADLVCLLQAGRSPSI